MKMAPATAVVVVLYDITALKQYEREAARTGTLSEMGIWRQGWLMKYGTRSIRFLFAAQRLAGEFTL